MDRSMTRANSPATSVRAKMKALSDLIRPGLPIGGGVGVLAGQIIALQALPSALMGAMGFLTAFFISGAAMISNDYFDRESTRSTTPNGRSHLDASRCVS
ncbi:MAG: hypothetical protein ACXVIP_05120 [Halobacteriota archaeon]